MSVIVDAHITSLITPLRANIAKLTAEAGKLGDERNILNEALVAEAKQQKLSAEEDGKVKALVAAITPFIKAGDKIYVHTRAYLHDKFVEKLNAYIKVAYMELSILGIAEKFDPETENYDDYDYDMMFEHTLELTADSKMKELASGIDELNARISAAGVSIRAAEQNIQVIQAKRAEFLSALNTQLLEQSSYGQQILGVLQNVNVPLIEG